MKLPAHVRRTISATAEADPRTIDRLLQGKPVMPMTRQRILRAMRQLGFSELADQLSATSQEAGTIPK